MAFTCLNVAHEANLGTSKISGHEHSFHCPNHDDEHPSLKVNEKKNVWMCGPCNRGGKPWELAAFLAGFDPSDKSSVMAWLQEHNLVGGNNGQPAVVSEYIYKDGDGQPVLKVIRYQPKAFKQQVWDGTSWNWKGQKPKLLYHLPELLVEPHRMVLLPEGEKDVDRLISLGFLATCNSGGSGKWEDPYTTTLKGHPVAILPDNDPPGHAHAVKVAQALFKAGCEVRVVELPDLKEKKDVSDWLDAEHNPEKLKTEIRATPVLDAEALDKLEARWCENSSDGFRLTPLGDLLAEEDEDISWLMGQHLPTAGLSILGGKPKAGKSVLSRCLALNVARGTPFLGFDTAQGSVFYLGLEEKRSEVKGHFRSMGATSDDPISVFIAPSPQDGLSKLHEVAERERPALIIVDPILKMVRVRDSNDYAIMSAALEPILTLARETGAHVLGVHHLGKGGHSGGDALLGSTAIFAAVDTAFFLKRSERYRTLSSIQRYGEDLEEIVLVMDPETQIISSGGKRKEADERQVGEAILEYLKTKSEPVEEKEIHEVVEGRKGIKVRALRILVEQDKVLRQGEGKRGSPYLYSFLVPTIYGEPENQKQQIRINSQNKKTYSGSQETSVYERSRVQQSETSALLGFNEEATTDGDIEFIEP